MPRNIRDVNSVYFMLIKVIKNVFNSFEDFVFLGAIFTLASTNLFRNSLRRLILVGISLCP